MSPLQHLFLASQNQKAPPKDFDWPQRSVCEPRQLKSVSDSCRVESKPTFGPPPENPKKSDFERLQHLHFSLSRRILEPVGRAVIGGVAGYDD